MLPDPKLLIAQFPAPAAIYEGPEHVVVAASDAYHRIVGGRNIIGKRFRDALPELVAQGFVEMLDRVRDTGAEVRGAAVPARWDTDGDGLPEDHFVDFVYSPLRDDGGAVRCILVLVTDVTDRVQAEAALQRSESRFRSVFAAAGMGMAIVDSHGRPLEVNPALRQMLGYESDDGLVGVPFPEFTHPEDVQADLSLYSELLAGERDSYTIEKRYLRRDGRVLWGRHTASLVRGPAGEPHHTVALVEDITARKRQEQARDFLIEASDILSSSLDYEATLQSVTRLASLQIADWCAVDELGPGGTIRRVAVAHPDPDKVELAYRFYEKYPQDPDADRGIPHVMRTGEPELVPHLPDEWLVALAPDPEFVEMARALDLDSYICVPLKARGRILGTLTFVRGKGSEPCGPDDLRLAEELARRAAMSIDNARLYRDREEARLRAEEQAEELQHQAAQLEEAQLELEIAADELHRANVQLEGERARLEAIIENAPVGIVIAESPSGRIVHGNRRIEEIFRHPVWHSDGLEEYRQWEIYHSDGHLMHPGEYPIAQALVTGQPSGAGDYRYRRGDGTLVWVRVTAAPIRGADGVVNGAVVLVDDIEEEKRHAEEREALLQQVASERRLLRQVFEHAPAVMALYSGPDHVITLVNSSWERSMGRPNAVGMPLREVFPEFEGTGLFEQLEHVYRTGESYAAPELRVPLDRWGSGEPEDTYWDLVLLPLPPRPDGTRDVMLHAVETTTRVRARRQVQGLTEAALAVHAAPTTLDALQAITDHARTIIGAHQAVVSLTDGEGWTQAITAVSLSDRYAAWRDYAAPTDGTGIYTLIGKTRRPMRLTQEELEHHPRWRGFGEHAGNHPPMRGWLAAPLTGRDGRDLGMIQLSDRYQGEFTEQDEALLVQLAQTASVAIENARLYQEAVEANQAKSGFLATMSHELRTPLNAMIGYADLLLMGVPDPISEAARTQVERIRWSARHLLQLIEEILTFSRLEAGRERVDVEPVQLRDLAQEVSAIIEPLAGQKAVAFRTELPEEPVTLETDPRKVRQILLNLLGNAVKFTERGEIVFRAAVEGERILLEVRDTGIGIAPEHRERVFEPFWQAETAMHARVGGTGLGLPVTAKLVQLLEGTIELDSEPGRGSLFRVSLPRRIGAS